MSFYQQDAISLYSWFLLVLSCNIFLMTFHGSIFLNIKLGPTTTSSPRRRGRGLHNLDSSHDQIRCFWLAEVRNFTNIMIEYGFVAWDWLQHSGLRFQQQQMSIWLIVLYNIVPPIHLLCAEYHIRCTAMWIYVDYCHMELHCNNCKAHMPVKSGVKSNCTHIVSCRI